ncbi:hypothetical protein ACFXGI_05720 [Streptomyces sp. NPDC059355]|uniref:hypothetical protein n=1 Tax=Streptomyces sp. NPDC059355 TaxID=3346811 RepID=UPI00369291FC
MRRHRTTSRRLRHLTALALTTLAATATSAVPAHADVTVGCTTADLVTAINNANSGMGDPVLNLTSYCVYEVTAAAAADDGLPPITLAAGITINGNNATIKRTVPANFRLFDIASGGKLSAFDLSVENGEPASNIGGGAILVQNGGTFIGDNVTVEGSTGNLGAGIRGRVGSTLTLSNSIVRDNRTTGGATTGGGIYSEGTTTLVDTDILSNRAGNAGGIGKTVGTLTVTRGNVKFNTADDLGAGLHFEAGTSTVDGTVIADNRITTGGVPADSGGGVLVSGGTHTIKNASIAGNKVAGNGADGGGGGIHLAGGTLTLDNTAVTGNQVIGENAKGGGILANAGTLNINNGSNVTKNLLSGRYSQGGGIHASDDFGQGVTVNVDGSAIDFNKVAGTGSFAAGVYNNNSAVTFTGASVSNNSAPADPAPGGIWTNVAITTVPGSMFVNNTPTNCDRSPAAVSTCVN